MDVKQAVAELNGRQYRDECSNDLHKRMKAAGIVAVFGGSDDLVYFAGAADDELGAGNGSRYYFTKDGPLRNDCDDDRCPHFERALSSAGEVRAVWSDGGFSWRYETMIPNEKFVIMEDDDTYCEGIVFALADIGAKQTAVDVDSILSAYSADVAAAARDIVETHLANCATPASVRAVAAAIDSERNRMERIIDSLPDLPGDDYTTVAGAFVASQYARDGRRCVQATKTSLLKRIRDARA